MNFKSFFESKTHKKTVALVPGSFKPMHKGHFEMIKDYAKKADEVVVIISDPKSKVRKTSSGKVITPDDAKAIAEIYVKAEGLNNVKVIISDLPSPVTAAYNYAEQNLSGCKVIFGASKKGGDWKRWNTVKKYFERVDPSIEVLDPEETAVQAKFDGMSATDLRNNIEDENKVKEFLPSSLSDSDIKKVLEILS